MAIANSIRHKICVRFYSFIYSSLLYSIGYFEINKATTDGLPISLAMRNIVKRAVVALYDKNPKESAFHHRDSVRSEK